MTVNEQMRGVGFQGMVQGELPAPGPCGILNPVFKEGAKIASGSSMQEKQRHFISWDS